MKIGSINAGINVPVGGGTEAYNKPTDIKTSPKVASAEKVDIGVKSQAEVLNEKEIINEEMLSKAIAQANKSLEPRDRRIERAVHEVTHAVMYTIKDTKTDEVIAEFPPRKIQDMIAKRWELAGLFVDEQA